MAQAVVGNDVGKPSDDPLVTEAQERFKYVTSWESTARRHAEDDHKFANGDAYNQFQWPNGVHKSRESDERPCLTLNQVRQHNLQIVNDAKQNKTAIQVRPTAGEASFKSAQVYTSVIRHFEYISDASTAYDMATKWQVEVGMGYWYYELDYEDDKTFNLSVYTRQCDRPDLLYLDPDIRQQDGLDAEWGFIFEDVPKKEFDKRYPKWKNRGSSAALGNTDWYTNDTVRVADYYRATYESDTLFAFADPDAPDSGQMITGLASELGEELSARLKEDSAVKRREVRLRKIKWHFIVGNEIVDTKDWPGKYIPIVRMVGEETVIDGILDRKGHTRAMIDPQRMYNYWSSSCVEHVALQSKTPWIGPIEAFEGFEEYWKTANKVNHAYLAYNGFGDDGAPVEAPQRQAPPVAAQAYVDGMKIAQTEIMLVSGQFQAQMGQPGNERSARAINERQRQGDNATYGFIDNRNIALRAGGKILIDLIPKVCDTQRVLQLMGDDGQIIETTIDPQAQEALQQQQGANGEIVSQILNPSRGTYDVVADTGPEYATRRQETFNAMVQLLTQAPQYAPIIGDIMLRSADFPLADEAAQRLRRMVPAQALGEGPSAEMQALQTEIQNLQGLLASAIQDSAAKDLKIKGKDQLRDIQAYDSETKRITALKEMLPMADPVGLSQIIQQLVTETLRTTLGQVQAANADEARAEINDTGQQGTDVGGEGGMQAQQGPDGNWYVESPSEPGKFMMVRQRGTAALGGGPQVG